MNRSLLFLFTFFGLAFAACTPVSNPAPNLAPTSAALAIAAASTPTSAATVANPTPDWSRVTQTVVSASLGQADQTLGEMTNWTRDTSGLRAELGAQADEMFALADQAQSAAMQELVRQVQSGTKPKGMPAPLPPQVRQAIEPSDSQGLVSLLTFLATAPARMDPQAGDGNPVASSNETNQAVGDNAHAHVKATATVAGSEMHVDVEMTVRVEQGGKVYEEQSSGKIKFNVCPDPQGNVPLDIDLKSKGDTAGGGYGLNVTAHVVGHVDDDSNLASIDQDLATELSTTKGKNWLTGAPETSSVQFNVTYTMAGLASHGSNATVSDPKISVSHASGSVSQEMANNAVEMGMRAAVAVAISVLKAAERKWQDGKCVEIVVPEGENQRVLANSETRFTAKVRQKLENQELKAPVIATLKSGPVSVAPSNTKVLAPATFSYKAPETAGREDAIVALVSRSRRGIGTLDVIFKTEEPYYNVDTAWFGSEITLIGSICSFDKPFGLILGGHKPPNFPYDGKVVFTPKDGRSGTWLATGTFSTGGGGTTSDSAVSTYEITGLAEGKPMIVLHEFTQKGVTILPPAATRLINPGPLVTTYHWPGGQITLTQTTGNCMPMYTGD